MIEEWERLLHGYGDEEVEVESLTPGNTLHASHAQRPGISLGWQIAIVVVGTIVPVTIALGFVLWVTGGVKW